MVPLRPGSLVPRAFPSLGGRGCLVGELAPHPQVNPGCCRYTATTHRCFPNLESLRMLVRIRIPGPHCPRPLNQHLQRRKAVIFELWEMQDSRTMTLKAAVFGEARFKCASRLVLLLMCGRIEGLLWTC